MLSQDYPVTASCAVLELPRSSYYHRRAKPRDQQSLREAIRELSGRYPTYGSRRVAAHLKLAPVRDVGGSPSGGSAREMGLASKRKPRRGSGTDSGHGHRRYPNLVKGMEVTRPNQVWVADISYIRLRSEFIYLAIVMDVFTRVVRGWHLSGSCGRELTLAALRKALQDQPAPAIHHSDQGKQYADNVMKSAGTQISMAAIGRPEENGYAERLFRTIKEEEVYLSEYESLQDARAQLGHFIDVVYHHERLHSALGYRTPAEFEAKWLATQSSQKLCKIVSNK